MKNFEIGKKYRVLDNEAALIYALHGLDGEEFVAEDSGIVCPVSGDVCVEAYFGSIDLSLFVPFTAVEPV